MGLGKKGEVQKREALPKKKSGKKPPILYRGKRV